MKRNLTLLLLIFFIVNSALAQVYRPFTPRYSNTSVRGNIVYVSNNIITSPTRNNTENPPGGTHWNDTSFAAYIDMDAFTTLIPWASTWRFCDSGYAPGAGTAWKSLTYNETNWSSATANTPASLLKDIGYGDLDQVSPYVYAGCGARPGTILPICGAKYWTTYFRRKVFITDVSVYANFRFNLHRDDGAVVYVNGVEVHRSNMPAGTITYGTPASSGVEGANEDVTFDIPASYFVTGNNQIAVEVHQREVINSANGNDLSFRLELLGNRTFSSSSANLTLPSCSQILFAGLYWGAATNDIIYGTSNMAWIQKEDSIKLKVPGAADYTIVTSTQTDYHDQLMVFGRRGTGYRCFANITSLLDGTNPNGTYWIADMLGPHGMQNGSGGWTIVIAYGNPSLKPRNLTVFDGSAVMSGGDPPLIIGVGGFLTPPGGPVSCELGAIVYDGDRVSADEFSFKQDSNRLVGTYTNLTPNATSNLNDMWNSTISYKGANVTTRNPAHRNTLGYDADIIDVPNGGNSVLGNNRTSASVRFSSTYENYFIHVLSTSISIYTPSFAFEKRADDLSNGVVMPGDSLEYRIDFENVGNDAANNTVIIDNIPAGTSFLPNSLKIKNVIMTDAPGDDEAEYDPINNRVIFRVGDGATPTIGGTVEDNKKGDVKFKVILSSTCATLSCINPIRNSAKISYTAHTSGLNSEDSSGINVGGGCVVQGASLSTPVGSCAVVVDTLLMNRCPETTVLLPWRRYAGYRIYSNRPFITANLYDAAIPVSASHIYWAYFTNGAGCADTVQITVRIVGCPDIDDDNDGIPDYVELNNPVALQDHNGNGIPNWKDAAYSGYVDFNADGFNDKFDPGADADNDRVPNFYDVNFTPYTDSNGDRVNDNLDKDLDGIPNFLDLDSDNDGIPDVVESYGVDEYGDGVIDNYTDTDADGFSQNVDSTNLGILSSGNGLGAQDLDLDGIANYLDKDSDNDGIPDIAEALGTDNNNDGKRDTYVDSDMDGFSDNVDGDVGNDGVAENTANALLRTGPDVSPVNGRADNYPNKNFDNDTRANPYDVDSDMDGITDVVEAGFPDINFNGFVDGPLNTHGWCNAISILPSLVIRNTDGRGAPDYLDIDADDDGIPDNVEGMTTSGYILPTGLDTDGDGLDNAYDNVPASFSGRGVFIADKDSDGIPDYRDLDSDADGRLDIIEGNDFNLDKFMNDDVALTLLDTDGDGLDNKFDSLNSVTNIRGTSYRMGTNGTYTGDATPGSRTTVQSTTTLQTDRDWRSVGYVLDVQLIEFTAFSEQHNNTLLSWSIITPQSIDRFEIERSIDNVSFTKVATLVKNVPLNETLSFSTNDNIENVNSGIIYYRLKIIGTNDLVKYSEIKAVRKNVKKAMVNIFPNPANDKVTIQVSADKEGDATFRIIDNSGRIVSNHKHHLIKGNNTIVINNLSQFSNGVYNFQCLVEADVILKKISIQN
jgi:uncharacterized repeat protein (TIGR01451 family)